MNKTRKYKDLTGANINHFKVIDRVFEGYKSPHWNCVCVCGKQVVLPTVCLINNNQQSCGCVNKQRRKEKADKTGIVAARCAFNMLRHNAKRRGYDCLLSFDEFMSLSKLSCVYCGQPPKNQVKPGNSTTPFVCNGIDRKNNTIGYTIKNSVTCCSTCNYAKRDMPESEWLNWLDRIIKYNQK